MQPIQIRAHSSHTRNLHTSIPHALYKHVVCVCVEYRDAGSPLRKVFFFPLADFASAQHTHQHRRRQRCRSSDGVSLCYWAIRIMVVLYIFYTLKTATRRADPSVSLPLLYRCRQSPLKSLVGVSFVSESTGFWSIHLSRFASTPVVPHYVEL